MKQITKRCRLLLLVILANCLYLLIGWQDVLGAENILAMSVSPDGRYTAMSRSDRVIISNGQKSMFIKVNQVTSLAFSPDGKWLAGGSYRRIYIWEAETGTEHLSFPAHNNYITTLTFSPDSLMLASGSKGRDTTIKLWNSDTGRQKNIPIRWDYQYSDKVRAIAFSPDGRLLASASLDRNIPVRIWDVRTGNIFHELKIKKGAVLSLAFSPGGEYLVSGLDDGTIVIYETTSGRTMRLKGHSAPVAGLGFTLDEDYLVSGGIDNSFIYWDIQRWKSVNKLQIPDSIHSFQVLPSIGIIAGIERGELVTYPLPDDSNPMIFVTSSPEIKETDRDVTIRSKQIRGIVKDENNIREVLINGARANLSIPSSDERAEYGIMGRAVTFSGDIDIQAVEKIEKIEVRSQKSGVRIKSVRRSG